MYHPHTLHHALSAFAQEDGSCRLLGDKNGWLTAGELLEKELGYAGFLARQGIRKGDWVALRMKQDVPSAVLLLALQALGAVAVLTDPRSEATAFLAGCTGEIHPRWELFADEDWLLRNLETGTRAVVSPANSCPSLPQMEGTEPAMVIFTSGSTGKSKGVILSQQNLISNLLDSAPLGGYFEDDVALGALPMYHVFGLALLTGAIVLRYRMYITPGNDLQTLLSTIEQQGITRMNGVPALYLNMARNKGSFDLHTLRMGYIGASATTPEQFAEIEEALGMTLVSVYGMSECIGISCSSYLDSREKRAGGVGPFYPMNTGKILRFDGSECAEGEVGEVCVNGPMRFLGYCDDAETKEAIDEKGFLHTGDLGYVGADGVLHLTGRKKDIIIRNGVNLSPRHIEEALLAVPGVLQAVVTGVVHDVQGEVPCAMAVSARTEKEILEALRLPKNEIPIGILLTEQIPLTASGKPDKVKIREVLTQWVKARF